jgi:uncharacterized protein (TIGR02271 family)
MENNATNSINWDEVIKKEARGSDDFDLGEVQEIGSNYVVTQKGLMTKEKFFLPKYLVEGYDGHKLWFNVNENTIQDFARESAPMGDEYWRYKTDETADDIETKIPVIEERLNVSKRVATSDATITKRPVTETKTVEVPVTHEEVTIERRPATGDSTTVSPDTRPVDSETEIKVPVSSEEVEVTKEPYVKEEVVVKKNAVTENRKVSDQVTSEKVDVKGGRETNRD